MLLRRVCTKKCLSSKKARLHTVTKQEEQQKPVLAISSQHNRTHAHAHIESIPHKQTTMEPIDPDQGEGDAARAMLAFAAFDRERERDDGADQAGDGNDDQQAPVLNEVALAQQQQQGPARVDLEKSSEDSQSSSSGSDHDNGPRRRKNKRHHHHHHHHGSSKAPQPQLPPLLAQAVVSVQKKLLKNNAGEGDDGGRQAVSSDDDDSSEDKQKKPSATTGDSTQQPTSEDEVRRLVLELAIVEQLIEIRKERSLPVLTNRATIHEAAVLVWQKLQSQPGADALLNPKNHSAAAVASVAQGAALPLAAQAPPPLVPSQPLFFSAPAPAVLPYATAPTMAPTIFAPQAQQQQLPLHQQRPVFPPTVSPHEQALFLEILSGTATLLDPAWVRAQIVSDSEQVQERRKRQRTDELYEFRYHDSSVDNESNSSFTAGSR